MAASVRAWGKQERNTSWAVISFALRLLAVVAAVASSQVGLAFKLCPVPCKLIGDRCRGIDFADRGLFRSFTDSSIRGGSMDGSICPFVAMIPRQTSRLFSSKNLWSIDKCLKEWNKQQANATHASKIQFVDATWFHKGERDGRKEFEDGPRLPGAFHWDTGDMATSGDLFPESNPLNLNNVFPPEWMVGVALEKVGVALEKVGVEPSTTLVVYGRDGTLFAPRVWYLLKKYYRCGPVKLLQGSMEEWIARGGMVDRAPTKSTLLARTLFEEWQMKSPEHPLISPSARDRLVDKAFVQEVVKGHEVQSNAEVSSAPSIPLMIDTRGSSFAKNGHIPGALHIPYASLSLSEDSLTLKPRVELKEILQKAIGENSLEKLRKEPVLLTCGTGVSVCTLALVLDELGFPEPWIYDGSWDEWKRDPTAPKEGGEGVVN